VEVDLDLVLAVDLEAADPVDRDSGLEVAEPAEVQVVEVDLDLVLAVDLEEDPGEVVREDRAVDLTEADRDLVAEVWVQRVLQLEEDPAAAPVPVRAEERASQGSG
jgi:hypothetical protein